MKWAISLAVLLACFQAHGQACFKTTVMTPSPLMGNHGEIFRTSEGYLFEVSGSYEYLYAYYPDVTICPGQGKMLVEGKTVGIMELQSSPRTLPSAPRPPSDKRQETKPVRPQMSVAPNTVVLRKRSCDYFIVDGPSGYYLVEWYGGYDPDTGDGIYGDVGSYGFKDVIYSGGQSGKVYVDDYMLGKDRALEKFREKCR